MIEHADQYTPEEILAAARNAEADGRLDYAVQFYGHLAQTAPSSPAGRAALDALVRLQAPSQQARPLSSPPPPSDLRLDPDRARAAPSQSPLGAEPALRRPPTAPLDDFDPSPISMAERLAPGQAKPQGPGSALTSTPDRMATAPLGPSQGDPYAAANLGSPLEQAAAARRERRTGAALPRKRSGFRAGRVLAWGVTLSGVLIITAAIAFIALSLFLPSRAADVTALLQIPAGPMAVGATLLVGVSLVLVGQLMSAVFVIAVETRDAATVLRARARDG